MCSLSDIVISLKNLRTKKYFAILSVSISKETHSRPRNLIFGKISKKLFGYSIAFL